MHLAETWAWVSASPLFALFLTIACYAAGEWVWERAGRNPLLTPLLTGSALICALVVVLGIDYDTYLYGANVLTFLLGPATVALALPLWRQASVVAESAPMVLGAVLGGAIFSILSGYWAVVLLGGPQELGWAVAPKSATTPIAMALAEQLGAVGSVAVIFVMIAGLSGAVFGTWILDAVGVHDPRARGLAFGVASHGIGTARAFQEGTTQGAFSGLAMGLTGLAISLLVTPLIPH